MSLGPDGGSKDLTSGSNIEAELRSNIVPLFPERAKVDLTPFLKSWGLDRARIEMSAAELDARERVDRLSRMWAETTDMPWQRLLSGFHSILTEMIRQRGPDAVESVINLHMDIAWAAHEAKEG